VPGIHVESVDSLGAGDAFVAGLLACLAVQPASTVLCDEALLVPALRFANAVGAITTTRFGAIPALPTRAQVETLLQTDAGRVVESRPLAPVEDRPCH
jgi:sugar/nucleoside kinase (ribokinase family)